MYVTSFTAMGLGATLMQETQWPGSTSTNCGGAAAQSSSARLHRVRNRQPDGQLNGLGTMPGMASRRVRLSEMLGTEFISPTV